MYMVLDHLQLWVDAKGEDDRVEFGMEFVDAFFGLVG